NRRAIKICGKFPTIGACAESCTCDAFSILATAHTKERPSHPGGRPFVYCRFNVASALEQAFVHPTVIGQNEGSLALYITLSLLGEILVVGAHALRFGPVVGTLYLVAVVHPG